MTWWSMRRFWRRLVLQFTRDDLFVRVASLWLGAAAASIGAPLFTAMVFSPPDGRLWQAALAAVGGLFTAWGLLQITRCFVPAQSWLARTADKLSADTADLEDGAILVVVFLLPAALVTLVLRRIGVSGQRCA
jgi:hypothetical protein